MNKAELRQMLEDYRRTSKTAGCEIKCDSSKDYEDTKGFLKSLQSEGFVQSFNEFRDRYSFQVFLR